MEVSERVKAVGDSITLKLNAKAVKLAEDGKKVYNLTAGQLPFRPSTDFTNSLKDEISFLKSYQYSPVAGFFELRQKIMEYIEKTREINFSRLGEPMGVVVCNGAKHALANVLSALINPGDEVITLAPYWVTYPEIIKFCRGTPVVVSSSIFDVFEPLVSEVERKINDKTKAIIVNSPNNPTGIHYSKEWMQEFAGMIKKYPNVSIISDEIYFELAYYDPAPTYFYQYDPELLKQTIILEGISKSLASTGLRIGYILAPKNFADAVARLQAQTTSGASSLVQRALTNFDLNNIATYLAPIKIHLRENSLIVQEKLRSVNLGKCWYQSTSAFYFLIDFSQAPLMKRFQKENDSTSDYSVKICEELLEEYGLAMVPGEAFGAPNTARMSLVLEKAPFSEAMEFLARFLVEEVSV